MSEIFGSEFFAGNRARLRQLFTGSAPVVLTANGMLQLDGDVEFPFAQDANFWYLTGITEAYILLVLDRDKEYLVVPGRSPTRETFEGVIDREALTHISGISDIVDEKEGWKRLKRRLKSVKHVATLAAPPAYIEQAGMYSNPARARLIAQLKEANSELGLLDLREHLARLRVIKQPAELEAIKKAIEITGEGLKYAAAKNRLPKYAYEYQVEADLTRSFRRGGASGHAFPPIVAGGARACALHNVANASALSSDELLVLDVGAEYQHYATDITRTLALSSNPARRQQAVLEAVKDVQNYALSQLKPGVLLKDYEQEVVQYMGEKLRELGLIQTISSDEVRRYYPHAASHFMGLNVHDVGDYRQPLAEGMVLTCEPGIYIPEEGLGIRIEDDVLITANGHEVLSSTIPSLWP
jgi:Xaa-Pro aminopeptidase